MNWPYNGGRSVECTECGCLVRVVAGEEDALAVHRRFAHAPARPAVVPGSWLAEALNRIMQ